MSNLKTPLKVRICRFLDNSHNVRWDISREHASQFFHSRLWIGVPFTFVVCFAVGILLQLGDGEPLRKAVSDAAIGSALITLCWVIGIWAATGRVTERELEMQQVEREGEKLVTAWLDRLPRWVRHLFAALGALLALALILHQPIVDCLSGDKSLLKVSIWLVTKVFCLGALLIPIWLNERSE